MHIICLLLPRPSQNERLRTERTFIQTDRAALDIEANRLRTALASDRETLATSLRENQARLALLSSEVLNLQEENGQLNGRLSNTVHRLEEETEVVEAVRSQLLDYKQMVQQVRACGWVGGVCSSACFELH